jgi:uncharacterized protein with ParB-like and HNH nuclease domain
MQASQKSVSDLLHGSYQYVIPLFQRYYCWTAPNWDQLWADLAARLEAPAEKKQFLGSLVTVVHRAEPGSPTPFHVIDGQQRLTTLSALLCAIRDAAEERGWSELAAEVDESFLVHRFRKGPERFKLYPRQRDRGHWFELVEGRATTEVGIVGAYLFFRRKMAETGCLDSAEALRELVAVVTTRIELVAITLDGENPYRIFKSLNSTGVDLEQGDLIRNHVFMAVDPADQDDFDDRHWRPVERHFERKGEQLDGRLFASFLRDVLLRSGEYLGKHATYDTFDERYAHGEFEPVEIAKELKILAEVYDIIRGRKEHADKSVNQALKSLAELQVSTSWPLVLRLMEAEANGLIDVTSLARGLRSLASFVLRRLVCGDSSRAYSRWFCVVCKTLGTAPVADLERFLVSKGWPTDRRFAAAFVSMDLYNSKYCRPILDAIERELQHATEPVGLSGASVEHVLPKTLGQDKHGDDWRAALGEDWKDLHAQWLDTPGNLTLVGADYNSSMRNRSFEYKQPVLGVKSVITLNRHFSGTQAPGKWSAVEIAERGRILAAHAKNLWPRPVLAEALTAAGAADETPEDEQSLRTDDIVRVLTRRWVPRGQRLFLKMLLEKEVVQRSDLHREVAEGRTLSGLLAALAKRINGTNLRSTGKKVGLDLIVVQNGSSGEYLARPELHAAIARLPELDRYLRESTWAEVRADSGYHGYQVA